MGRKARNTERGSRVVKEKRKRESLYEQCLVSKATHPALSIASIARTHSLCARELQRRWRRYQDAQRVGDITPARAAAKDRRGGHNRAFTDDQERVLREQCLAASPAMTQNELQQAALQLKRDVLVASSRSIRESRRVHAFVASPRFITQFKRRNRLSSHRRTLHYVSQSALDPVEREHAILTFVHKVRTAIDKYGARNILNMDETPVPKCEHPTTGIVATGCGRASECKTDAGNRLNVTHFPCISASGNKLQMCAVVKGKTARSLRKITDGASAAVSRVRLYYSQSGWINAGVMIRWLEDVVKPYLQGERGALVMDDYHAHWTTEVKAAARRIRLRLIKVPGGMTSYYQPLDVSFNGPMTKARQRMWLHQRLVHPLYKDSHQNAVERAQLAYEGISRESTIDAWRKAWLVD